MPATVNLVLYRGASRRLRFIVKDENGAIQNVAGWTTKWRMRKTETTPDPPAIDLDGSVVGNGTSGAIDVVIDQATILAVAVGTYKYGFERVDAGFEDLMTLGDVDVKYDRVHPK